MHKSKLHCVMNWVEMCISFSAKKKKKILSLSSLPYSPSDISNPLDFFFILVPTWWLTLSGPVSDSPPLSLLWHGLLRPLLYLTFLFSSPCQETQSHRQMCPTSLHHREGCVYYCSMCMLGEPLQCLLCKLQKETSSQRNSPWLHVSPALFGLSSAHREWEQPGKQSPTPHRVQLDVDISSQSWQDTSVLVATSMCTDRGICTASSPDDTDSELGSYFEGMLSDILGAQLWIAVEKPWCHLRSLSPGARSTQLSSTQKSL